MADMGPADLTNAICCRRSTRATGHARGASGQVSVAEPVAPNEIWLEQAEGNPRYPAAVLHEGPWAHSHTCSAQPDHGRALLCVSAQYRHRRVARCAFAGWGEGCLTG
jgi:hypothetical protein